MLVTLDTPYVDTSAADLSVALGGPERPALHVRELTLPGGLRLRLRLLGASHLGAGSVVVALCLGYAWITAQDFEVTARQQLYQDPVVHAEPAATRRSC